MKLWLLITWSLSGPVVGGAYSSEPVCNAVADSPITIEQKPVRFCVPLDLDKVSTDVLPYPQTIEQLRIINAPTQHGGHF